MIAITTKYIGPTNHRGGRVKASASKIASVTLSWEHGLNVEANHRRAAEELARLKGWDGRWVGGDLSVDGGFVYVLKDAAFGNEFTVAGDGR